MTSTETVIPGYGYALPRMLDGFGASARAWTVVDAERAALGASFRVYRTTAWESVPVAWTPNVDLIVPWQAAQGTEQGTGRRSDDMWSTGNPPAVTIRTPGTYLVFFQFRFAAVGPYAYNGSTAGLRKCRILLNGTAAPQHSIASSPPRPGSVTGDGVTCQAFTVRPLRAGDVLLAGFRHSAPSPVTMSNTDAGGTFMAFTRLGPGAQT